MHRMVKPRDEDIFAFWPCDEASGNLVDDGADSLNLTISGTPGSGAGIQSGAGSVGSRSFDSTERATLATSVPRADIVANDSSVSFACWLRPDAVGTEQIVFRYGGTSGTGAAPNTLFSVVMLSTGEIALRWQRTSSGTVVTLGSSTTLIAGNRYLVGVQARYQTVSTAWGRFFYIYGLDDDVFVETDTSPNFLKADGGTGTPTIQIADASNSSITIQDVMFSPYAFRPEWFRYQYMLGARKFDVEHMLQRNSHNVVARVRTVDANGDELDFTNVAGRYDMLRGVSSSTTIDDLTQTINVVLEKNVQGFNLSPYFDTSPLNPSGAALDAMRPIEYDFAVLPSDVDAYPIDDVPEWLWERGFEGYIASVRLGGSDDPIVLVANDRMHPLMRAFIKTQREYGTNDQTKTLGQTLQERIDDNWSLVKSDIEKPTIWDRDEALWAPTLRVQEHQHLAPALQAEAQYIGFDVRYMWDELRQEFRLTLAEPPRSKTVADFGYEPTSVYEMRALDVDDEYIINSSVVRYVRSGATPGSDGQLPVSEATASNAASITRFGERVALLTIPSIQFVDEAEDLAVAVVNDLKEPIAVAGARLAANPYIELNDLVEFGADDNVYDGDISLAVSGFSWALTSGAQTLDLQLRGTPAGKSRRWRDMITLPGEGTRDTLEDIFIPTAAQPVPTKGVGSATISVPKPVNAFAGQWASTELHVGASGFTPSSSTLVGQGALTQFPVASLNPGGTAQYAKAIYKDINGNVGSASPQVLIPVSYTVPTLPSFAAHKNDTSQAIGTGSPAKIEFQIEDFDTGSNYDTSNHRFTAPRDGLYGINAQAVPRLGDIAATWRLMLYVNGSEVQRNQNVAGGQVISTTLQLDASDYVEVFAIGVSAGFSFLNATGENMTRFSGHMIVDLS